MTRSILFLLAAAALLVVTACDSTEPDEGEAGEQELISNVTLTLTPQGGGSAVTAEAVFDESGALDASASQRTLTLAAGTAYGGSIDFRNRFADDAEEQDITAEVRAEAMEHQVFYAPQSALASALTATYADDETDYADVIEGGTPRAGVPVGLAFTVDVSGDAASTSGDLRVVLGHYDERPKNAQESIDDVPERDVDVTFQVTVQ